MTRREFFRRVVLAASGITLAACGDSATSTAAPTPSAPLPLLELNPYDREMEFPGIGKVAIGWIASVPTLHQQWDVDSHKLPWPNVDLVANLIAETSTAVGGPQDTTENRNACRDELAKVNSFSLKSDRREFKSSAALILVPKNGVCAQLFPHP